MYEDDNLFAKALAALNREFGQRKKLLEVTQKVKLVPQASIPVFRNVAALQSDISYLIYIVRSNQVWGVRSKLANDFDFSKRDFAFESFHKLNQFMHAESFSLDQEEEEGNDYRVPQGMNLDQMTDPRAGITKWDTQKINEDHQMTLEASNLQAALEASLDIDYNISFKAQI